MSSAQPSIPASLRLAAADIKLAHSIFALPFAVLASFLARDARDPWPRFAGQLALVVLCMFFARSWAMMVNRLADRRIDAANARTRARALASGKMGPARGWAIAATCAGAFVGGSALFLVFFDNSWPLLLSLPVLAWIAFYSYTKRFTALCHIFLGGALGASPLAAAIAVNPASLSGVPALYWLAGFVVLWVAGFDVLYALQDIDFDRGAGLSSIPARLGAPAAKWAARLLHAGAFAMLLMAWRTEPRMGISFAAACAAAGALLIFEHIVVARRGPAGIPMAFFTVNGIVSCILGAAGIIDLLTTTPT